MNNKFESIILGGGITGLAAGVSSGLPIFESTDIPGGICSSYYVHPHSSNRLWHTPPDENVYRFEIGGGHWIFGGDIFVLRFINKISPTNTYLRKSSVFFPNNNLYVPYPLQNNLRYLENKIVKRAIYEMERPNKSFKTMRDWLKVSFGTTLCNLFFLPFHSLYTGGLHKFIEPQDAFKTPVNMSLVRKGATKETNLVGYNVSYLYPQRGLNDLARQVANKCNIYYGKKVININTKIKMLFFEDGSHITYKSLLSTLPLNHMMKMTNLTVNEKPNPYTSVLVLNIGATRGPRCPDDHWLYIPTSRSGFHRVGFYSNVDVSFIPKPQRKNGSRVSLYIEKAFSNGSRPSKNEVSSYARSVINELKDWGFIGEAEVVDPTWIDVAYTWSYPGSRWKERALQLLEKNNIFQAGRYGRWTFQGIADSVRDGFISGSAFKA